MDFKVNRAQLVRGLSLAAGIADRKSTLPILANALLKAEAEGKVVCAATDLHVTFTAELNASVQEPGGLTIGAKQLHDIVKGLSADEVHIQTGEQNWAEIRAGRAEFKVVGMADRDFPKLPDVNVDTVKMDASTLKGMIGKTIFSVSSDETRQHLAGVLLEVEGERVRMVSTDGHRLSRIDRSMETGLSIDKGVLIPRKGVLEIRRLLEAHEGACDVGLKEGHMIVKTGETSVVVKLSDSQFPPYDQVIPKDNNNRVTVARDDFLNALRRVSIMASDKTWGVRLSAEKGWLRIEADSPDLGNARERIEVEYAGEPVQVGFNARYIIELLGELDSAEVQVDLAGELDPAVIRASDSDDYLGVVMPMRL